MLIGVSKLDEQQRKRIIKKLVEKLGLYLKLQKYWMSVGVLYIDTLTVIRVFL